MILELDKQFPILNGLIYWKDTIIFKQTTNYYEIDKISPFLKIHVFLLIMYMVRKYALLDENDFLFHYTLRGGSMLNLVIYLSSLNPLYTMVIRALFRFAELQS